MGPLVKLKLTVDASSSINLVTKFEVPSGIWKGREQMILNLCCSKHFAKSDPQLSYCFKQPKELGLDIIPILPMRKLRRELKECAWFWKGEAGRLSLMSNALPPAGNHLLQGSWQARPGTGEGEHLCSGP